MKTIELYQVDAFTEQLFRGNPAAVCPLEEWLEDDVMQKIALENNLSETAFVVSSQEASEIRWFTPKVEVDLCGHATLAAAHVLFNIKGYAQPTIEFNSRSGPLKVSRNGEKITLDFPADPPDEAQAPPGLMESLRLSDVPVYRGKTDFMLVLEDPGMVEKLHPDFRLLSTVQARGIIVTAPGREADFVSRFFAPACGIDEDPVTGSAHCTLTPYWVERLGKNPLTAHQLSARKGSLECELADDRVKLSGKAITYLQGTVTLNS